MGDEENDVPDDPGLTALRAWEKDDKNVLIYDRYDIWSVDPATGHAVNLPITLAAKIKLSSATALPTAKRNLSLLKKVLWLIAQNEENKQWGYYKKTLGTEVDPLKVIVAQWAYSACKKQKMPMYLSIPNKLYTIAQPVCI
jgi:hypothetical protein